MKIKLTIKLLVAGIFLITSVGAMTLEQDKRKGELEKGVTALATRVQALVDRLGEYKKDAASEDIDDIFENIGNTLGID